MIRKVSNQYDHALEHAGSILTKVGQEVFSGGVGVVAFFIFVYSCNLNKGLIFQINDYMLKVLMICRLISCSYFSVNIPCIDLAQT